MIFVDTDVLSIFAKIQRLPLLFTVFNQESLHIASAVANEIETKDPLTFRTTDPIFK